MILGLSTHYQLISSGCYARQGKTLKTLNFSANERQDRDHRIAYIWQKPWLFMARVLQLRSSPPQLFNKSLHPPMMQTLFGRLYMF